MDTVRPDLEEVPEATPFDATEHLQKVSDATLGRDLLCRACGAKYNGEAGIPVCPLCEQWAAERHLSRLQSRRFNIQQELADITGQIETIVRSIQKRAHVEPGITETTKCMDCGNWLHLGWIKVPGLDHHVVCEACGTKRGIKEGYQRSAWCHHGYPIKMCRPCRAVHSARVRAAEESTAKRQNLASDGARPIARAKSAPRVDLADLEEI